MRFIGLLIVFCLMLFSNTIYAENVKRVGEPGGGGIIYGSKIGIGVSAPAGWTFDAESGVSQGLHGVMYPDGSSWSKADKMMYVNIGELDPGQKLDEFIQEDIQSFLQNSPDLKVERLKPIAVQGKEKAEVRLFTADKWRNFEEIAYVEHKGNVAIYVLSSRTKSEFENSRPAFTEMVEKSFIVNMVFEKGANQKDTPVRKPAR